MRDKGQERVARQVRIERQMQERVARQVRIERQRTREGSKTGED